MYQFEYKDNHIIADIEGKKCLIDTGSPISLGKCTIEIDGQTHSLENDMYMGESLDNIAGHVGCDLDALIGGDILSAHEALFVWLHKGEILFHNPMGDHGVPLELFNLIPIISISIEAQELRAYIDTGAKQSYISSTIAQDIPHEGTITDFYPTQGEFTVPVVSMKYIEPSTDHKKEDQHKFAILPESLEGLLSMANCDVILGMDWLKREEKSHFLINYRDKKFIS